MNCRGCRQRLLPLPDLSRKIEGDSVRTVMTEQSKLVPNAQESTIFKSNATAIKIKCSNNFPRLYSVEITYTSLE